MNILYAVSEAAPFIKTGGLGDVAGSLPKALCTEGVNARVILPLYSSIAEKWREKMQFLFYTTVHLSWRRQYAGVYSLEHEGVTYYFVDNEFYFKRGKAYGEPDDGERFGFFSRAVVEIMPLLDFKPDIVSCNDWQTALIPIYLRYEQAEFYREIKSVFTIHNIEYQGRFIEWCLGDVFGLPRELYDSGIIRYENDINLMKGAIYKADYVTTVSPGYAWELRNPYFACGLHKVIEDNAYKFSGIVNGIDMQRFSPENDRHLPQPFSADELSGKRECKRALCRELGMDENDDGPIIACISRLVSHKGCDLISAALDSLVSKGVRVVILGTGDSAFENRFRDAEYRHKGRVSSNIMYSEQRASLIYAGADMLLMPSKSEPCGLSQLIAMRYGTLPVVHAVGGLRDTVRPYPQDNSNGFSFGDYSTDALLGTVDYAVGVYYNKEQWRSLMKRAMTEDLGWSRSAKEYIDVYRKITQ